MDKRFGLLFFSLLLAVFMLFIPYIVITPATQLLVLAEAFLITYLYPPAVIFKGFFRIVSKQKSTYFWQLWEALIVIFATVYIFIYLYRGLFKGIISAQSMIIGLIYFFLAVSSIAGLMMLDNDLIRKKPVKRLYITLLTSTVVAGNVNMLMLNTANITDSFVGTIPILWRLLPLLIFTIPSLIVLLWQFSGRGAETRATFLIWSGLGSMLTVAMIYFNSFGLYYIPIYFLLAVTALIIEFLPKKQTLIV